MSNILLQAKPKEKLERTAYRAYLRFCVQRNQVLKVAEAEKPQENRKVQKRRFYWSDILVFTFCYHLVWHMQFLVNPEDHQMNNHKWLSIDEVQQEKRFFSWTLSSCRGIADDESSRVVVKFPTRQ